MNSTASQTVEAIGWHLHGKSWVWGVLSHDGCELCDLAERWLAEQKDWRQMLAEQIRERRAIYSEPVTPQPKQYVDPHQPLPVPKDDQPSLDKIKQVEQTELIGIVKTTMVTVQPDNEVMDNEPLPPPLPPKAPEPFKLSNPDPCSLTKGGRRRK